MVPAMTLKHDYGRSLPVLAFDAREEGPKAFLHVSLKQPHSLGVTSQLFQRQENLVNLCLLILFTVFTLTCLVHETENFLLCNDRF